MTRVLQDGNQIGDRGAEMIVMGLKVNSSLRQLHLVRLWFCLEFWLLLWCLLSGWMCSGVFQHWGCTCLFSVCIEVLSQDKQSSGPFNFSGSSSLMRGCRNLDSLSFECCDWSACVGSESWGELPVPPAEVIARGTKGVFEFVKAMLSGGGFHIRGEVVSMKSEIIDLSRRNLIEGELLPLLESFRDKRLSRVKRMKLVIVFVFNVTKMLLGVTRVLQDGNQIGDRGAEMIVMGLKVNSSLRQLHLVRLVFFGLSLIAVGKLMEWLDVFRRVSALGLHVFV